LNSIKEGFAHIIQFLIPFDFQLYSRNESHTYLKEQLIYKIYGGERQTPYFNVEYFA
jgi:hypothetical protein